MGKAKFGEGTEWEFWKQKGEGAQGPGEFGGFYTAKDSTSNGVKRALIKSEQGNVPANISEFLGSKIFAATAPGYGADVSLMVPISKGRPSFPLALSSSPTPFLNRELTAPGICSSTSAYMSAA